MNYKQNDNYKDKKNDEISEVYGFLHKSSIINVNGENVNIEQLWDYLSQNFDVLQDKVIDHSENSDNSDSIYYINVKNLNITTNSLYISNNIDNIVKIVESDIINIYKHKIYNLIFCLELENGLFLKITNKLKLLTQDGWNDKYHIGMSIALPKNIDKYIDIKNDNDYNTILDGDIIYLRIIKINSYVTKENTYQLRVNKYNNFLANGIVCHDVSYIL